MKFPIAALILLSGTLTCVAELLFHDEFAGSSLDFNHWQVHVVFLNPTQTRDAAHFDSVIIDNGTLKLPLETHNPTAVTAGDSFYGTDIYLKTRLSADRGLAIEARLRLVDDAQNPLPRGIVAGFFLFETNAPGHWDEIDFELLSNDADDVKTGNASTPRVLTNVFDDYPANLDKPVVVAMPDSTNLTAFTTYRIQWYPDRIEWYVLDGGATPVLVRTEFGIVPDDPMNLHLNIHAPGPGFATAYDASLQPTAGPEQNQTFFLEIDSITVSTLNDRPDLVSLPLRRTDAGESISVDLAATDPNSDTISLMLSAGPPFVTLADDGGGTGRLIIAPGSEDSGSYVVTVSAMDDGDPMLVDTESFVLLVGSASILDIDGNRDVAALTDGLLILRYLFGIRDQVLTDGVVGPDCSRCSAADIQEFLDLIRGPN